jgi:hypothetical protein
MALLCHSSVTNAFWVYGAIEPAIHLKGEKEDTYLVSFAFA